MMAAPKPTALPLPSRNPLPLSASQEQQVRDMYYKRVRSYCANEIRDFASCALNRTFSATWACRPQRLSMNKCMISHATQEEQDAARDEWFATQDKRIEEREAKQRRIKIHDQSHREWWGLPQVEGEKLEDEVTNEKR